MIFEIAALLLTIGGWTLISRHRCRKTLRCYTRPDAILVSAGCNAAARLLTGFDF